MKHAYLIMTHKIDNVLKKQLLLIDCMDNDIYIHMDSKLSNFNKEELSRLIKKSNIYFVDRTNVKWGDYSQVNAELILLKAAVKNQKYIYYHLLSGEDLPIKSQKYIHHFFNENKGKEFINFQSKNFSYTNRVRYYHLLQRYVGRGGYSFINIIEKILLVVQKIFRVNRSKNLKFQKGANWFSITDDLARYVVKKEWWIKKHFRFTNCPDEVFLQSLVINSRFKKNLYRSDFNDSYEAIMRLIDWKRGNPYVFKLNDFEEIISSNMLFCRKFQSSIDNEIVEKLYSYLMFSQR